jgi:hypothetical protein
LEKIGWEGENTQRVVVPNDYYDYDDDDNDDDDGGDLERLKT